MTYFLSKETQYDMSFETQYDMSFDSVSMDQRKFVGVCVLCVV